jgi:hypothetical protein
MQRRSRTAARDIIGRIEEIGIQIIPRGEAAYIQGPLRPDQAEQLATLLLKLREHWQEALAALSSRDEFEAAGAGMRVLISRTEEAPKNPAAVALGKLGGSKGGLIRAKRLSKKRRVEIGKLAAKARWGKK